MRVCAKEQDGQIKTETELSIETGWVDWSPKPQTGFPSDADAEQEELNSIHGDMQRKWCYRKFMRMSLSLGLGLRRGAWGVALLMAVGMST